MITLIHSWIRYGLNNNHVSRLYVIISEKHSQSWIGYVNIISSIYARFLFKIAKTSIGLYV